MDVTNSIEGGNCMMITVDAGRVDATAKTDATKALQEYIDQASAEKAKLFVPKGRYLVTCLFLRSGMEVEFEEGAELVGNNDETLFPIVPTRVAGVEMPWYPGRLNICGCHDVKVKGGVIDGQGPYWWNKYWGSDQNGGLRAVYDAKGLRWAADYDCMRPRNLVVMNSKGVVVDGLTSRNSGFWNIHVCYSSDVRLDGCRVQSGDAHSPSTDGIDIDSSHDVVVENCVVECNDDSICIKSGRDADGWKVARPCHDVVVRNCLLKKGFGVTIGSEVSGGVYGIRLENLVFEGTDCGFRIKSSRARRGWIRDIEVSNLQMTDVKYVFNFDLDWNPAYSYCALPEGYEGEVKESWRKLLERVPDDVPNTKISSIRVNGLVSGMSEGYSGPSRAFTMKGFADQPMEDIVIRDASITCREMGVFSYTSGLSFENTTISVMGERDAGNDVYDNR